MHTQTHTETQPVVSFLVAQFYCFASMKTLAKCHICNHCVIGEKTCKNTVIGPDKLPELWRNGPWLFKGARQSPSATVALLLKALPGATKSRTCNM